MAGGTRDHHGASRPGARRPAMPATRPAREPATEPLHPAARRRRDARRRRALVATGLGTAVLALAATAWLDRSERGAPPVAPGDGTPAVLRPAGDVTTATPRSEDLTVVWADEFDGDTLDRSTWEPYHNTFGHGNNELACLTPDNVELADGTVRLTARRGRTTCPAGAERDFTSGFLGTRETGTFFPRFGRFEIRARLPHGQGLWPAFWLRHRDGAKVAEVDVMEYFHSQVPGHTSQTLHLDGEIGTSKVVVPFEDPTDEPGWHTWAVDIAPANGGGVRFTFLLDGEPVHRWTDVSGDWQDGPDEGVWDLAVNLAVGGEWAGHPDDPLGYLRDRDACAAGGVPPYRCTATGVLPPVFPATYEVDHVRVYELP